MGLAAFNRMRRLAAKGKDAVKAKDPVNGTVVTKPVADMNWNEMRAEAKLRDIAGYGKMGKEELTAALSSLEG